MWQDRPGETPKSVETRNPARASHVHFTMLNSLHTHTHIWGEGHWQCNLSECYEFPNVNSDACIVIVVTQALLIPLCARVLCHNWYHTGGKFQDFALFRKFRGSTFHVYNFRVISHPRKTQNTSKISTRTVCCKRFVLAMPWIYLMRTTNDCNLVIV